MDPHAHLALLTNTRLEVHDFGRPAGPGPLTPDIAQTHPDPVRARLAAILGPSSPAAAPPPRDGGRHTLERLAPGLRFGTPFGETYVVREVLPHGRRHGGRTPRALLGRDASALLLLCGLDPGAAGAPVDPRRWLFLDAEATGLSGWAGNLAFVVAFGYLGRDGFVVDQYLVRSFEEEAAALHHAAETAQRFDAVVSFNGRSFDAPLLRTRARMNRVGEVLAGLPHLDLLHPARRVFGPRLDNCRLQTLEREVLGLRRVGDLPGHLVPPAYFEYLHTADARPLLEVLRHNRADVRSLATLADALLDAAAEEGVGRLFDGLACEDGTRARLELARGHGRLALDHERRGEDLAAALHHARCYRDRLAREDAPEAERARAGRRARRMELRLERAAAAVSAPRRG